MQPDALVETTLAQSDAYIRYFENRRIFGYRYQLGSMVGPDGRRWRLGPFAYQEKFHRCLKRNRWNVLPNRTGKSHAGAAELLMIAMAIHPWRPNPILGQGRTWNYYAITTSHKKSIEVQRPLMRWYLPEEYVKHFYNEHAEKPAMLILHDPRTKEEIANIHFMCFEQNAMEFESSSLRACWADEELNESIYNAILIRLLDTRGDFFCTMTPFVEEGVGGVSWSYDRIMQPWLAQQEWLQRGGLGTAPDIDPELWVNDPIRMADNPALPKDEIERIMRECTDPEERQCRFEGKYMNRTGRVFTSFKEDLYEEEKPDKGHLLPESFIFHIPRHWNRGLAVDPSSASSVGVTGTLWYALAPAAELIQGIHFKPGDLIFYREYRERDKLLQDNVANIKQLSTNELLDWKLMDGRFGNQVADQETQETYQEMYQRHGLKCSLWKATTYSVEIEATKSYLGGTLDRMSRDSGIFVLEHLTRLRQEIRIYQYPISKSGPMKGERQQIQRAHKQKGICLLDCFKAVCAMRLTPRERYGYNPDVERAIAASLDQRTDA